MWVPETDPDTRWRHALVLGVNRAVGDDSSIQGDYRIYHDTWGITSHTIGARYFVNLGRSVELRLRERFYTQNARELLPGRTTRPPQQYMTFDRELSSLWSETFGAQARRTCSRRTSRASSRSTCSTTATPTSRRCTSRTGTNIGLGVSVTY